MVNIIILYQMYGRHRLILFLVDLMIFVWEWWKKVKKKNRINQD